MIKKLLIISTVLSLVACESANIENETLNDRVKACGGGFSVQIQNALQASLSKAPPGGSLSDDFKDEAKVIIIEDMPDQDKLKAYEDYIGCIEKNWNGNLKSVD